MKIPFPRADQVACAMPSPSNFQHAGFQGMMGISRREITPPAGIYARNWGAAEHDTAETIHRPLWVSVLTLADSADSLPLILIDADLGWWRTPQVFEAFRQSIRNAIDIPVERLIVALSHTHAGPPLMEIDPELPGSDRLRSWMDALPGLVSAAVREAWTNAHPSLLEWHSGSCGLASLRDFADPFSDSRLPRYLCGFNPEQRADQTLWVGRITGIDGQMRGTLVNYACHPTTLAWQNKAISPDYVGAMRETIQQATGAPAFFLLGACGELAPRYQYTADLEVADAHGRELGYAALSVLSGMELAGTCLRFTGTMESGAPLAVWTREPVLHSKSLSAASPRVVLPLKDWPSAEDLERQRVACMDRALAERLRRKRDIRRGLGDGHEFSLPLTVWKIGSAILVGSCCEAYSILQQELRRRFPGMPLICMNLINGSLGYLPPADHYDLDIYPVWQTPFDRGSLERLLEAMTRAIRELLEK